MCRGLLVSLAWNLAVSFCAQSTTLAESEKVSFPTVLCSGQPIACRALNGVGYLFALPGSRKVVLISHGSQGIDGRMLDYVDALRQQGIAGFVIDHWGPRGIDVTHNDYAAAELRGGSALNVAFDALLAAEWLRRERGYERIGSMGESQSGNAAILLDKKTIVDLVKRNAERIYGRGVELPVLSAIVSLYGYCGVRRTQDVFNGTPFLFLTGAEDDETPSRLCEQYVPWMNERGAGATIVVLPGVGHSFDAPYSRTRGYGEQFADCDLVMDATTVKDMRSGESMPGSEANLQALMKRCHGHGFHTGSGSDRFVGVPYWIEFFKKNL
jgi:dienelactone hydrolase